MTTSHSVAKALLDIRSVQFSPKKPFVYTSGMKSPIYADLRLIMSYPPEREIVIRELITLVGDTIGWGKIDVISGTATAGVPFASWVADRLHKPMVYVRDTKKNHGLEKEIEGTFHKGASVLVIEDIVSSGKSSLGNIKSIQSLGGNAIGCVSVASYEIAKANQGFKSLKIPLHYLVSMQDLVNVAVKRKLLSAADRHVVWDWLSDPSGWAKRQGF